MFLESYKWLLLTPTLHPFVCLSLLFLLVDPWASYQPNFLACPPFDHYLKLRLQHSPPNNGRSMHFLTL